MSATTVSPSANWPKDRKPPVIDPTFVQRQSEGFVWSEFQVRLPEGATVADLNENPDLFRLVQNSSVRLRRFDKLRIFDFDETWMVETIVVEATDRGVTLPATASGLRKLDLPPRNLALPEDDLYRVTWVGNGFRVTRKRDGQRMGDVHATIHAAARHMETLRPRAA
jgi:hypothetical protein